MTPINDCTNILQQDPFRRRHELYLLLADSPLIPTTPKPHSDIATTQTPSSTSRPRNRASDCMTCERFSSAEWSEYWSMLLQRKKLRSTGALPVHTTRAETTRLVLRCRFGEDFLVFTFWALHIGAPNVSSSRLRTILLKVHRFLVFGKWRCESWQPSEPRSRISYFRLSEIGYAALEDRHWCYIRLSRALPVLIIVGWGVKEEYRVLGHISTAISIHRSIYLPRRWQDI